MALSHHDLGSLFARFGLTSHLLQLDPANKQAFVQFTSNAEALLALRSPEAVMGNRFIQVYLKKDEAQEGGAPAPVAAQPPKPVRFTAHTPCSPDILDLLFGFWVQVVRPAPTPAVPQPAMVSRTPTSLVVQPATAAQPKNLDALKKKQQELFSKQLEQQKVRMLNIAYA
jgi:RNA-binding protein 26